MANRESILSEIENKLTVVPGIATVRRKPITSGKELNEIAHTEFPVVNIIGGLPGPKNGRPIELGIESYDSSIRSELEVFIRVFGYNKENPDTEISTLMNLIYQNLYYDPNLKGYDYTDKASNVLIDTDTVVFCTENTLPTTFQFRHMKSLDDFGVTEDLSTLPYSNPIKFTDVTDSLTSKADSTKIRPSAIVEYRDPFFVFMLIMTVEYTHQTYEI